MLGVTMASFDQEYYAAQLRQNERLASEADNLGIRALHLQYVQMYRSLLEKTSPSTQDRQS